jgi:hypothetical protein
MFFEYAVTAGEGILLDYGVVKAKDVKTGLSPVIDLSWILPKYVWSADGIYDDCIVYYSHVDEYCETGK